MCFAAPRCADLTELLQVQLLFAVKYGKEFVSAATELMPNCGVNRQVRKISCLRLISHNRTLMAADLRLCGTHFSAASELSLFVLASPTAKQRMLEPLASIQEESFRKRGQRDFKREF